MKNKILYFFYLLFSAIVLLFYIKVNMLLPLYVVITSGLLWFYIFEKKKNNAGNEKQFEIKALANSEEVKITCNLSEQEINDKLEKILTIPESLPTNSQIGEILLSQLARETEAVQGLLFLRKPDSNIFSLCSKYAFIAEKEPADFTLGEGLHGQVAKNMKKHVLADIGERYVASALGSGKPVSVIIIPIMMSDSHVTGVVELAFLKKTHECLESLLDNFSVTSGSVFTKNIVLSDNA